LLFIRNCGLLKIDFYIIKNYSYVKMDYITNEDIIIFSHDFNKTLEPELL